MRPSNDPSTISDPTNCVQLTDRRIYFTWTDATRREDIPLIEDAENALGILSALIPSTLNPQVPLEEYGGCSFTTSVPLSAD